MSDNRLVLLFGFCKNGPYKYAYELLVNPSVRWVHWSYQAKHIDTELLMYLSEGMQLDDQKVYFGCWDIGFSGEIIPIRSGHVDYCSFNNNVLRVNIKLDECDEPLEKIKIKVNDSKTLCKFLRIND